MKNSVVCFHMLSIAKSIISEDCQHNEWVGTICSHLSLWGHSYVCVCILWHCGDNYTQIIHKSYKIVYVYKCPHKKVTDVPIEKWHEVYTMSPQNWLMRTSKFALESEQTLASNCCEYFNREVRQSFILATSPRLTFTKISLNIFPKQCGDYDFVPTILTVPIV